MTVLAALFVLAGIGLTVVSTTGCAERLFFWPSRNTPPAPTGIREVEFTSADGTPLHGWFIPAAGWEEGDPPAPAVLHTHGNAGHLGVHAPFVAWLRDEGMHVFIFDYRGYGKSGDGRLRRGNVIADALAAYDEMIEMPEVDPEHTAIMGFSLGSTIAIATAAERPQADAVVTAAGFSSWRGVASDYAGALLARVLIPTGRDSIDTVTQLGERPLLMVHGDADSIVDYRHLAIVEHAASEAGINFTSYTESGSDHNDLLIDHPEVRACIAVFLREHLGLEDPEDSDE